MTKAREMLELADRLESCEAIQVIYADRKETIQPAEFKALLASLRLAAQADAPTSQWPDVLAATNHRRQEGLRARLTTREPRGSYLYEGHSEGDRLKSLRRSPIRTAWKRFAANMWKIKRQGTPEQYAAHVRILQLLDQAQRELEAVSLPSTVRGPIENIEGDQ